jgi:hypothetical protein
LFLKQSPSATSGRHLNPLDVIAAVWCSREKKTSRWLILFPKNKVKMSRFKKIQIKKRSKNIDLIQVCRLCGIKNDFEQLLPIFIAENEFDDENLDKKILDCVGIVVSRQIGSLILKGFRLVLYENSLEYFGV